ncbi:succinate dehydrogenase/fumarate reductase iron-sulfur subunit [bacterium]|nr:succinate dehydrogenase/fumarate reductase iron-sulfur subunit [bacterium]HMW34018.1 succinate dehydrogenase/fumarate reductase iron-sulfur subunit [bacterium]HMZ05571.1 succinate dehydrogenase/fumarate reductase iron-sulfur subunit [bacterium]HNB10080.1 succinate dehydrogenase/fumarate reductase iron-sulfur subunit [bacterium]HNB56667.1 succinate dehydrogenase/fumarate reductase iron-sulfur subunit [bacterium]
MEQKKMTLHLKIWRQKNMQSAGKMVDYTLDNVSTDMSFLEMLDVLNERIIKNGEDPIEYDNDCREGICGMCSMVINGVAHGPEKGTATCQLHMRKFKDGDHITVEPWRASPFPVVKDLATDRSAFDAIIAAGGYTSCRVGSAAEANALLVPKDMADKAMDAAACIGCGACVAACPNGSASLFVSAKIAQFTYLPQGHAERKQRVLNMVNKMDELGFGDCSNHGECEAVCPKEISITHIAIMRKEYLKAALS